MMENLILIILVIIPAAWSGDWRVTLESQCALKGTSAFIKCDYDYPFGHFVTKVSWSKALRVSGSWKLFALSDLPSPPDHFTYVGNKRRDCSLRVKDVQLTDEGAYYFSFVTTFNRWRSKTFAYLYVKELTTVVQPSTVTEGDKVSLTCVSGCSEPTDIVWFRDGRPVSSPVFRASREDAGRYYCAVLGQETVRSASVALSVQYAPSEVTLSVSPSGGIIRGGTVTFTCSSNANPPVTPSGYKLYKDGQIVSSGQNHTISDILPSSSGWYYCQAWNNISWRGIDLMNSSEVYLDVRYRPMNISVSVDPQPVAEGTTVNLTCSSDANPPADDYTWYKRTDSPSSSSMLQLGSGQVLSLLSMEAFHTGLYLCQVRNSLGENNSTEFQLVMEEKQQASQPLTILAGIGVCLCVTLVIALLLFWKKQRTAADKKVSASKQTVFDFRLSGQGSSSSAPEDPPVYANIYTFPSSAAPANTSQRNSRHSARTLYEDEVTYSAVTIKPRNPQHMNNSRATQPSWSKADESSDSVIYATVVKSS